MYRNLTPKALGLIGCRDNELVELAMTYRFLGMELNLQRFQDQVQAKGLEAARRYLCSAPLRLSSAELPLDWTGDDDRFASEMSRLPTLLDSAQSLECPLVYVQLMSASPDQPFQQNFELHCRRLASLAQATSERQLRLGLAFSAIRADSAGHPYPFIQSVEGFLAILKMVSASNICLILDTWHWTIGGGTLDQLRGLRPSQIGDVRLADLPTDVDPSTAEIEHRLLPSTQGIVRNLEVVSWLADVGYEGPLTPAPHRTQLGAASREQGVERATQSIDRLWEEAG
ncbi:MAG TPA: sugar phosphate isomerase/epimerase, partial [Pirellulaceae bacterium]